ncbi:MAG: pseudouridine synthase [Acaryochloridaceae cyanobacterium RL_2_7]|nr:pseudouridine synthase [Acaryochloridaceae cyanobacterium RL_2_7]
MAWKYLLFYKPYGVLSQFTDQHPDPRLTLKHYIDVPEVYTVGRLDKDSEGLMLLTNHGWMQNRICDPKFAHPRTYWVQVEKCPTPGAIAALRSGVTIKGYRTRPAEVSLLDSEPTLPPRNPPIRSRKNIPTAWLEMTLTEGKNRQVRRMTATVGFPTLRLVRIAIGPLKSDGLEVGQWRYLSDKELRDLKNFVRA